MSPKTSVTFAVVQARTQNGPAIVSSKRLLEKLTDQIHFTPPRKEYSSVLA